ncbi:MAG: polysaccharide biosynthesis protein [Solirubrobacterales bacterium]|nr:polysaccharide biosynthesis protein [Solirubrobacterales bacterium]
MTGRATFRESFLFGILSFGALAVLGVASGIVIARAYGIEVVGAYALAYAPVGVCGTLSTMQEQAALVKEVAVLERRDPRITGLFAAVSAFSAGLTLLVGTVTALISTWLLSGPIGRPDLVLPAIVLLVEFALVSKVAWNLDWVFAAFRAGRQLFWIRLAHALVYLAFVVGLSFVLDSVWALVLGQVGAAVTSLVARLVVVRAFMRLRVGLGVLASGMREFPKVLKFGSKLAGGFVAEGASVEAGTWLLGLTSSIAVVGAWNRAWQLVRRLMDPTYRVAEILFPTLVERRSAGDRQGFDRALLDSSRVVGAGLLLIAAVLGGAADGVMDLYGPGFDQAAPALAMLLVVPALYCLTTLQSQALLAFDRPLTITKITVTRAVIIVGGGVPLTLVMGLTGMALATLVAYAVDLTWRVATTRRHLAVEGPLPWPLRTVLATVVAYAAGFGAARVIDAANDGAGGLLVALVAGSLAFFALFVLVGGLNDSDHRRLETLAVRLRPRRSPVGGLAHPEPGATP